MNLSRILAKALTAFGTNSLVIVIAGSDPQRRLTSISPHAVDLLRRLIAAGGRGVEAASLSPLELRGLSDEIERKLGIRVRRARKAGFVILAGHVQIVDQRTSNAEAA